MSLLRQGRYVLRVKETPLPARQQSRHPWLPPSRGPAAPSPADNGCGHDGERRLLNPSEALGGLCRESIVAVVENAIFRVQIAQLSGHSKTGFIFFLSRSRLLQYVSDNRMSNLFSVRKLQGYLV